METAIENKFVEEKSTKEIEKAISSDQNAVPYSPMSNLVSMGTVVPLNLAGETLQAQFKFLEEVPDVDAYLVEKLGYSSKYALSQALSAEQADAVALAIRQIEKDKGFILADMAGIGKGRVGASMIRYAITNGYTPIFVTEKPNLFSAMYRDITDIGGVSQKNGKIDFGYPLILNGFKSGGFDKTYDEFGNMTKTKKPSETGITNSKGEEIIVAPSQKEIAELITKNNLPKKYDLIMLTYSQLAGDSGKKKVNYLTRIIEKTKENGSGVIMIMDECHNAAGTKSDVGKSMSEIISLVKGVTFVSATFSKRPDNMNIYALKTDIADSPLGTKKLIEVIKEGGERLTENLASNLVASQQMLRRERTFENCNVEYNYMSDSDKTELFTKYDNAIQLFRDLVEFFETDGFIQAKKKAIEKFAIENKVELVTEPRPSEKKEVKEWIKRNEGKFYRSVFTAGEVKRNQFQFIETLLFSLKADFVANQTLSQLLDNQLENLTIDKVKFKSSRKPVIAVRNTLEGVYYSLGLEVGQELEKADFSMYVYALALDGLNGAITLKEITEKDVKKTVDGDIMIQDEDFEDNGEAYRKIKDKIFNINLDIPLSPIDYIINKIESTKRPAWDNYGDGSPTFTVGEVTGRKFTLVKQPNGKYKLESNQKPKNKGTTFKKFNSGFYDVLLINESGSTGEDAHSSSRFADQRPRVMIIHQVELDVNTEVQKRGRINRTGMVNYPTYIYAVSRIPSEVRRLLMLVRKLRSLDANTTANQKQSAKLSAIKDSFGNEIEDVINKYGDDCLYEFISVPANEQKYLKYMPKDEQGKLAELSNSFIIEVFVRNLELSLSEEQEYFYNTINALYIQKKENLGNDFDLETNIVDLKASIKTRVLVSKGLNTNPFNTSVYEEDDYVLAEDKPYNKEKVDSLVAELAKGQDADQFYENFIADYKKHYAEVTIRETIDSIQVPDYESAKDEMEKMKMEAEYNLKVKSALIKVEDEYNAVLEIIDARRNNGDLILKPNRAALVPAILEECYETDEDGNPQKVTEYNNARFVGVRILNTAKEKYSPMNIELIFCQLSGKPKLILKPTSRGREILSWVVLKSTDIIVARTVLIDAWEVDPNKRTIKRLLTGNILGAYGIAKDNIVRNPLIFSPVINFLKFTTADGTSIRLGINLNLKKYSPLIPKNIPVQYPLGSQELIQDLIKTTEYEIKSVNSDENFELFYERYNKQLQVSIFGGTSRETKGKKVRFFSELYENGELQDKLSELGIRFELTTDKYLPIGSSKRVTLNILRFTASLNSKDVQVSEIFKFIYSLQPFNVSLTGVENKETIFEKKDLYNPELAKTDNEREGVFRYNTLRPYDTVKNSVKDFSKFDKYVKTSDFGTIYLKKRANIKEAISYGLVPLDNTIVDMVSDTFQTLTSDTDKIKLKEDINKAITNGEDDFEIGQIVKNALYGKVQNSKQIFGLEASDLDFIGDVFRRYTKGEVALPEKKKREDYEEDEKEKRPLNLDSAQDFLILLTYKIKN
jgi:hypothetical protein